MEIQYFSTNISPAAAGSSGLRFIIFYEHVTCPGRFIGFKMHYFSTNISPVQTGFGNRNLHLHEQIPPLNLSCPIVNIFSNREHHVQESSVEISQWDAFGTFNLCVSASPSSVESVKIRGFRVTILPFILQTAIGTIIRPPNEFGGYWFGFRNPLRGICENPWFPCNYSPLHLADGNRDDYPSCHLRLKS